MSQERVVISYLLMLSLEPALVYRPFSRHVHSTAISELNQERTVKRGVIPAPRHGDWSDSCTDFRWLILPRDT
jgi:hypothetical protein